MKQPTGPEVSDVFRAVASRKSCLKLSAEKDRIFNSIVSCKTEACGLHLRGCTSCGYVESVYNSCWNRHCPKCRGGDVFSWVKERLNDLLPVPYFHVVFTLPHELNELVYANKEKLYDVLFESSSATLTDVTRKNLSLTAGFFGVLHTWNQELQYHPHIHYLVPGGGLHLESKRWQNAPGNGSFFLPVRVLGEVYRGKFLGLLKSLYRSGKLYLPKALSHLQNPREFERYVSRCASKRWVVYAKKPFAGPEVVVKYLASYTHRVGISNSRICQVTDTTVTFLARDKTNPAKKRAVTITHEAFVQRFLQHGLPKGFRRIRYYGFLAVHRKAEQLPKIREELGTAHVTPRSQLPSLEQYCPSCRTPTFYRLIPRKPHKIRILSRTPAFLRRTPLCAMSP